MKAPFIMIDHHQNRMIMQHTRIQTPLLGPPAKCYTISSLFLIKKKTSTRQLEPAFIGILTDSGSFRFPELLETRIE
jgi:nanoRNase/pAp phosphatase (c-di-AMP/oligoRNAs hydrolase)